MKPNPANAERKPPPNDKHPTVARTHEGPHWVWKGLRDRYRPDQRISRGMVTSAPWIDVVLLIVFFLMCTLPFVLQPGIAIDLPTTPIGEGHPFGHSMVIVVQTATDNETYEAIVFFDDRRFRFDTQREALREAMHRAATRRPDLPLILEADHRVRHGLMVDIYTLATEVGIRQVNVATRPH